MTLRQWEEIQKLLWRIGTTGKFAVIS